jgi:antitoxin CptB
MEEANQKEMTTLPETIETRRKRLAWRSTHRGIREMDVLMGGFAAQRLKSMSEEELTAFESIIEMPDQQLLSWFTGNDPVPAEAATPLLQEFLQYRP